jgi:hypothetical protein
MVSRMLSMIKADQGSISKEATLRKNKNINKKTVSLDTSKA